MKRKLAGYNVVTAVVSIIILVVSVAAAIVVCYNQDFTLYVNQKRLELKDETEKIEKGIYMEAQYPYIVVEVDGTVIYADEQLKQRIGDYVIPEELFNADKSSGSLFEGYLRCTFMIENDADGICFLAWFIPQEEIRDTVYRENMYHIFLPLIVGITLVCVFIIIRAVYCSRRILRPLEEISRSADAIVAGNYDVEVRRIHGRRLMADEIGKLVYSFEQMRDEVRTKQYSEQRMRESQQELISCISHDLRTPISTIKAYGEGLRDNIASDEKTRQMFVEVLINKADVVEHMIAELLEYSNSQINQLAVVRREIYFIGYMKAIAEELEVLVEKGERTFEYSLPSEDFLVRIDEQRIAQVLYNLVENSLKYTAVGGRIRLHVERKGADVRISVEDNGVGMDAEDIPYIFDRFYRAEKSRSQGIPGSGLGLAICKYIVEQHNGEINCASSRGKGTRIWFTIEKK